MNRSRVCMVTAAVLVVAGCGSSDRSGAIKASTTAPSTTVAASTAPAADPTTASEVPTTTIAAATTVENPPANAYSTQHLVVPLDVVVPDWLSPTPAEDSGHFVTWVADDGRHAIRILNPVEVYQPGSAVATAPPDDFTNYMLGQADAGVQLSDRTDMDVDGRHAVVVTMTSADSIDGSFGCPSTGLPPDACFGPGPDVIVRVAVMDTDAGPLLFWLRLNSDAGFDVAAESSGFDAFLTTVRFADREPVAEAAAEANALDGTYQWTLTADDAKAHDPNYTPDADATYPWTFTLTLDKGKMTLRVENVGEAPENYAGTFDVDGDQINFHNAGFTQSFTLTRDPDGTLHATAASPMEGGDKYVMTTKPWTKLP